MTSGTIAILEHDIWDSGFNGSTHLNLGQWMFLNLTSGTVTFLEMFRTWHLGQRFFWKHTSGTEVFFEPHMWDRCLFGNVQNMTSGTIAILEHDIWDSGFYGSTHLGQWVFLNHTSGTVTFLEMFRTWHLGQLHHSKSFNNTSGTFAFLEHDIWDSGIFWTTHLG